VGSRAGVDSVEKRIIPVKLLLLNHWISSISTSLGLENKTTRSYMACDTSLSPPKKDYPTKRRYQQTRRDKQKTPQIMNDQLDTLLLPGTEPWSSSL
jgi:hypothetical protein